MVAILSPACDSALIQTTNFVQPQHRRLPLAYCAAGDAALYALG
jgi:hypothetical protein